MSLQINTANIQQKFHPTKHIVKTAAKELFTLINYTTGIHNAVLKQTSTAASYNSNGMQIISGKQKRSIILITFFCLRIELQQFKISYRHFLFTNLKQNASKALLSLIQKENKQIQIYWFSISYMQIS